MASELLFRCVLFAAAFAVNMSFVELLHNAEYTYYSCALYNDVGIKAMPDKCNVLKI